MDALSLLSSDHRKVESLFHEYQSAATPEVKKQCVDKMIMELSMHSGIEELKFYPQVKERAPQGKQLVEESLQEHQQVKEMLAELERMKPEDSGYDAKVQTLIGDVKHHVQEEEGQLFPNVRSAFNPQQLDEIGRELEEAKRTAPTHPHPMAPAEGPAAQVAARAAGAMDRARDMAHPNQAIREEVRDHREEKRTER